MHSGRALLNKTASQVENERSILKAITIQGVIPVIVAFPIGMVLFGVFFFGWSKITVVLFYWSDDLVLTLTDVFWCIFVLTPTIDALVDLIVVKQYRTASAEVFARFPCVKRSTSVSPTNENTARVSNRSTIRSKGKHYDQTFQMIGEDKLPCILLFYLLI
jgi:hypothetical protein